MIYFDNAATTMPKPPQTAKAVANAVENFGNPSRASYDASLEGLRCMMQTRAALSDLFCVGDPSRVAFTANATTALNIAISNIKGHIVTTAAEHNSVLRPLHRRGNYSVVQTDILGRLDIRQIENAIKTDTEAIVMGHASNLTGNVFDIVEVGEICRRKGIKFVVDAAQSAGLISIDMQSASISALCFSGHKSLYGPQGIGGICISKDFSPTPLIVGGSGSESFSPTHPIFMPDALEAGTQNTPAIAGLLAGINYVKSVDIFSQADKNARNFVQELKKNEGIIFYGDLDAKLRTPVVTINFANLDSGQAAALLWEKFEIAVRAGAHCAPLMHAALGTVKMGAVRFSFSHFNTDEEIDFAVKAVRELSDLQ